MPRGLKAGGGIATPANKLLPTSSPTEPIDKSLVWCLWAQHNQSRSSAYRTVTNAITAKNCAKPIEIRVGWREGISIFPFPTQRQSHHALGSFRSSMNSFRSEEAGNDVTCRINPTEIQLPCQRYIGEFYSHRQLFS